MPLEKDRHGHPYMPKRYACLYKRTFVKNGLALIDDMIVFRFKEHFE